ncbi:hypothetical protein [Malaciobacter mytili]|uniref:Protein phosphatase CheZ n=2 Tax=Malaciobacter mytili TaxID=603050 RepID=A0AAX2AEI8_9BACT|nr:hypothetical protein [Malaciobacter mytili]AXH15773.1 hypothetical protein AMYT_2228 [Malaciobacter mytili LMG 24559]RXI42980.1 hypothetical protein CRU99_08570 [Malaciobacter mytili]RXK15407.1 hypothetical protein CP985_08550 [Malaciobacter mytili LMG 24559]
MSMSQEEIESLMNGLDLNENEKSEEVTTEEMSNDPMSNDDIEKLLSESNIIDEEDNSITSQDDLDDILASIDEAEDDNSPVSNDDIDELLKGIDGVTDNLNDVEEETIDEENFDDILAGIDGITDSEPLKEPMVEKKVTVNENNAKPDEDDIVSKIDSGIFPLPAEKDTKVVNQLSQVANDSEEKASKIFDVLSFILDDNNDVQRGIKSFDEFLVKQIALLDSLNKKFPNISVFNQHLEEASKIKEGISAISGKLDAENMQIFEAMELMQFHDINRQKIERVMAVIRKLSIYLNNLFEDEGSHQEIAVAKHIHGDNTADVVDDADLESLIAEFGN